MSRITTMLRIAAVAAAAGAVALFGVAPAHADGGIGLQGATITPVDTCDGVNQGVQVDATFGFFGTSIAGVLIDGVSVYETPIDSGETGQDEISHFAPLGDGTHTVSVYAASKENVLKTEEITLVEGCTPLPPSVESATASASCVDGVPTGTVNVNVVFPEGNEPATLAVTYGSDTPLGASQTVTASGSFPFTGQVPVGETNFAVVLNGIHVASAKVVAEECKTDGGTTPPVTPPAANPNPPAGNPPATNPQKPAPAVPVTNPVRPGATGDIVTASAAATPLGYGALGIAVMAAVALAVVVVRRRLAANH